MEAISQEAWLLAGKAVAAVDHDGKLNLEDNLSLTLWKVLMDTTLTAGRTLLLFRSTYLVSELTILCTRRWILSSSAATLLTDVASLSFVAGPRIAHLHKFAH